MEGIADIMEEYINRGKHMQTILCTVVDVDKGNHTITAKPVNENADMLKVRLRSVIENADTGLIVYPLKNSKVLVSLIDNNINQGFVSMYSEIEAINLKMNNSTLVADENKVAIDWPEIVLNGGTLDGLPISQKVVDEINALKQVLNTLKTILAGWTPSPADGGAALKTAISTWAGQQLNNININAIENTKVKQ